MKQTIDRSLFEQAFENYNRVENFGYDGLRVLFEYLEELEDSTGEELELDVIALCCDYSHDTVQQIIDAYQIDVSECEDDDAKREEVRSWLLDNTAYCGETETGFVYCSAF
jgi:Holliday junction resolvasome RuvABC ATP-dependent DNA helicase subunit